MTPVMSITRHEPPDRYGDCVRACIASIMDMTAEQVPHFYHDGPDGPTGLKRVRDWLEPHGLTLFGVGFPGELAVADVMQFMADNNPNATWLLFGSTGTGDTGGDHVVVCQGGRVEHDPQWVPNSIKGPGTAGFWQVMVVSKL